MTKTIYGFCKNGIEEATKTRHERILKNQARYGYVDATATPITHQVDATNNNYCLVRSTITIVT